MKRFPIGVAMFTLVWALALFLPPTREISRSVPILSGAQTFIEVPPRLPDEDPLTVGWKLEETSFTRSNVAQTLHQMDALAARYPTQLWIPAMRVRMTSRFAPQLDLRIGESQTKEKAWLDAHELEQAAQIAAQAGQREPDNCFWPWMEASLRFSLRQKARGVEAMERAGKAPRFNDYIQSTLQARLALWKKHDNPAWEQRIGLWAGVLLPHLAAMRGASNAAAIEAADARGKGDDLRAIEIDSTLLRANQVFRRDSFIVIGDLVAEANGFVVVNSLFNGRTKEAPGSVEEREKRGATLRKQWIAFTRANGRSDIIQSADWLAEPSMSRQAGNFWGGDLWGQFGVSPQKGRLSVLAPLLLFGVAILSFFLALVYLVGALASIWAKDGTSPSRGQITTCANFGFWSLLGAGIVAFKSDWLIHTFQPFGYSGDSPTPLPILLIGSFVLACWLLPVAFLGWKGNRRFRWVRPQREARALPRHFGRVRVAVWLLFGIFCGFVATNDRGTWDGTPFQLPISAAVVTLCFFGIIALEIVRIRRSGRARLRLRLEGETSPRSTAPFPWKLARLGAWSVALLCAFLSLNAINGGADLTVEAEFFYIPIGIVAMGAALFLNRKIKRCDGFTFRLATRTAGVLALAWSVVFLFASLAAWPLRAELNRQLDRRLSMREVDWMKEQIARFPMENSGR